MYEKEIAEMKAKKNVVGRRHGDIKDEQTQVALDRLSYKQTLMTAEDILIRGAAAIGNRASERDTEAERSMCKTVLAFNAMFGKDLTEVEGWQFMVLLKMCRGSQGDFRMDDYEDQASYGALAGETAQKVTKRG